MSPLSPISEHDASFVIAESLPQMVWITDPNGQHLYVNRRWEEYTGIASGEIWTHLVHPEDRERVFETWAASLKTGHLYSTEFRLLSKEQQYRWFLVRGLPVRDQNQQILRWTGTLTDIHDHKETEERLRATERQLQTIFDSAGVGVVITEPLSGQLLRVNKTLCDMLGYTQEELLRISYRSLTYPEDLPELTEDHIRNVLRGNHQFRRRFYKKNGEIIWVLVNTTQYSTQEPGNPFRSLAVIQDVTKEQMATLELQKSEKKFKDFASLLPQILWSSRPDGTVDYVNDRWIEYTGLDTQDIDFHTWKKLIHPDDYDRNIQMWREAQKNGIAYEYEYRLWDQKEQTYRWFLTKQVPVKDDTGNIIQWIGTSTDIEEQKKASEARHQAQLAIESSRLKSEFLANMSHEIRTPIHGVLGMTHLLRETNLSEEQLDYLETAEVCTQGLLDLVNDILDYSRIDADKIKLEAIDFDLQSLRINVERMLGPQAQKKNLRLKLQGFDEPQHFLGDPKRIRQVLINLVSNAIKFSIRGAIEVKALRLASSDQESEYRFEVVDQGIGIEPRFQSRLFQPFFQVDSSMSREFEGSGLGLSICKKLVEAMGGILGVESAPNKGSKFWFTLKLLKSPETVVPPGLQTPVSSTIASTTIKAKVLVVEDNIVNQKYVGALLSKLGLEYHAVNNGHEALRAFQEETFDLILMDCQMPLMDGYETTKIIREGNWKFNSAQIPIIAVTANAMKDNREKCLDLGMNDFITKPVSQLELETAIFRWLPSEKRTVSWTMTTALKRLAEETSPELCFEALEKFRAMAQSSLEQIETENNFERLIDLAQSLRSSAEILGADGLARILFQIEQSPGAESAKPLIGKLKIEMDEVFGEIPKLLPSFQSHSH